MATTDAARLGIAHLVSRAGLPRRGIVLVLDVLGRFRNAGSVDAGRRDAANFWRGTLGGWCVIQRVDGPPQRGRSRHGYGRRAAHRRIATIRPVQLVTFGTGYSLATPPSLWPRHRRLGHASVSLATPPSPWPRQRLFGHASGPFIPVLSTIWTFTWPKW